ncbi:hydroxymyristoyl-ACP dehydratase [Roseomonas aerophila]|uniref:Hydroxymyristoyl-ACP dehydratase n=1 Tax=Teichococcus aerophilus TaxID=1224513 RepID=A0ABR7RH89_9PROT|nr:hydroxymyristoyl-ACP dehydratase [Pseudoroseomonas aerophila]
MTHQLDHAGIAALVPHAGSMCLLDHTLAWNADSITCGAVSHRDVANPLRRGGVLPAVCGVEYALQAMALHGALTAQDGPQAAGYLASLRNLDLGAERLDDVTADLLVEATALAREARSFVYAFRVTADGAALLSGQAAIILPPEPGA